MELPDSPRVAQLRREWTDLQKAMPPAPEMAAAVTEGPAADQHVFLHGDHHTQGVPVDRVFPVVLAGDSQKPVEHGSGRLELANWIASEKNPMTARVMVNRVWQWNFGEALVRTPNNWGKTGDTPANPELLDYLAARFVESGWSVKALNRLIVTSSVYRMSADAGKEAREADPSNRLQSHFNRVRMPVEAIRDSLLAIAGKADETLGGKGEIGKKRADIDDLTRRTMYIPVRRGSVPALLSSFDFGDATTVSEGRARTNVAPQALFMMNSRFVVERSLDFARELLASNGSDGSRVVLAYEMALARDPDAGEVDSALTYMNAMEKRSADRESAWQSFCHALLASNEFLYLD